VTNNAINAISYADTIYKEIIEEIKPLEKGILYNTIRKILLEDDANEQITREICCKSDNTLSISPNASIEEDYKIAYDVMVMFSDIEFEEGTPGKGIMRSLSKMYPSNIDKRNDNHMEEIKLIVLVGCTLVGGYFCIQYLKERQNKKKRNRSPQNYTTENFRRPLPPVPAALCLIIPANIVGELTNGSNINIDYLSYLVDNASDFVCATKSEVDSIEQQMTMTEKIPLDSIREVYIRINLADGRNLIGKKILYMIKTNLQIDTDFFVEKVACLQNLNGLKFFNHV